MFVASDRGNYLGPAKVGLDSRLLGFSGFRTGAAGLDLFQSTAATGELLLDELNGRSPHERFRVLIPGQEKGFNGGLQISDAEKDAPADGLVVQVTEPSLSTRFSQLELVGTK